MKQFVHKGKTVDVSIHGNIYFNKKRLNQYNNGNGYLTVSIFSDLMYVHRIVCEAFNGNPIFETMQVNHLDGNRNNNHARNLQWVTPSDNQKHAFKELGRVHSKNQLGKSGFNHHYSKPVDQICIETGQIIKTFGSREEAAKAINVDPSAIYNAIVGRCRVKYCKGFKWAYNSNGNQYKPKYVYSFENGIKKRKLNK